MDPYLPSYKVVYHWLIKVLRVSEEIERVGSGPIKTEPEPHLGNSSAALLPGLPL